MNYYIFHKMKKQYIYLQIVNLLFAGDYSDNNKKLYVYKLVLYVHKLVRFPEMRNLIECGLISHSVQRTATYGICATLLW